MNEENVKRINRAFRRITDRMAIVQRRIDYVEGNHASQLGTKSWNRTYRTILEHTIDNQLGYTTKKVTNSLKPQAVSTSNENEIIKGWAKWGSLLFQSQSTALYKANFMSKKAEVPTAVLVDYDTFNNVAIFPTDPRSFYVQQDAAGNDLYGVHYWTEADEYEAEYSYVNVYDYEATYVYRSQTTSTIVGFSTLINNADYYKLVEVIPNTTGLLPFATINPQESIIDQVIPLQDMLNKGLQTQLITGENSAYPLRVLLGIDALDEETGQIDINKFMQRSGLAKMADPATGSRAIAIPSSKDAEGNDVKFEQFTTPGPGGYLTELDSFRLAIARLYDLPAFILQIGGIPEAAESLEIRSKEWHENIKNERLNIRPAYIRIMELAVIKECQKIGVSFNPKGMFDVEFAASDQMPLTSRITSMKDAVAAGMSLADALVEFLGWGRDAADLAQENGLKYHNGNVEKATETVIQSL